MVNTSDLHGGVPEHLCVNPDSSLLLNARVEPPSVSSSAGDSNHGLIVPPFGGIPHLQRQSLNPLFFVFII